MEYLNEYFGYDRNLYAIKQEAPLDLVARSPPMIQHQCRSYVPEKIQHNYKPYENQESFQHVSRRSIGSPSCTSDSESSISSHERLSASPIDIVTITNNNNVASSKSQGIIVSNTKMVMGSYDPTALEMDYQTFRAEHLAKLGLRPTSNQNMKRMTQPVHQNGDPTYREKREKNNLAAKKSRDARKYREDEMVVRCAFLESELMKSSLVRKQDKASIEEETAKLKELDLAMSQQLESINEFQRLIFQLKSNINNSSSQTSSLSI